MELYLLKSAACLLLLFLFYKAVLENTTLHTTKRFFLLGSLVISFLIPFITFTEYIEVAPVTEIAAQTPITNFDLNNTLTTTPTNYIVFILWGLYSLGVLFFSTRFLRNTHSIFQKVKNNPTLKKDSIWHVLLKHPITPHSFFNYIFFSKKAYEAREIPQEVIVHEKAHVQQKHSWDILFFELLRIVFWFNPLFYFIKHSIKLNHEFLADRAVLQQGADAIKYQTILLDFSSTSSVPQMAHSINYSSIKKRFTVMKTHTSKRAAWLKGLLLLPLLAVLIYGFSSTQIVAKTAVASTFTEEINITINESKVLVNNKKVALKEFANILNKLTRGWDREQLLSCHLNVIVKDATALFIEKLEFEYKQTTLYAVKQKKLLPPPPPAPAPPKAPMVKKDVNDNTPNIPPPPPSPKVYKGKTNKGNVPPPPPPPKVYKGANNGMDVPPPPPPPVSLLDHIVKMAKNNATFYYEGQQISSDKAIEIIKNNSDLHIQTTGSDSKNPQVKISTKPITVNPNNGTGSINATKKFHSTATSHTEYVKYAKQLAHEGAIFYWGQHPITANAAIDVLQKDKKVTFTVADDGFNNLVITFQGC